MRTSIRSRVFGAALLSLALVAAACGESGEGTREGPTITVGSFNFPESVILAEIYAQALEADGYPVDKRLNLGSRELIFPSLESGEIDFLPEYLGSALIVGFGLDAPTSTDAAAAALSSAFATQGVAVLDPAPGEDKNVFVVTQEFASTHGSTVESLADAGPITLGGPPECEGRDTCYQGLQNVYGLGNLAFESIQEGSARVAALDNGDIDVALLFSTQPVIAEKGFVALEETQGLIAPENIIPVVGDEIADAYGSDFAALVNRISASITTEVLLELNGKVELRAEDPADVAREWLIANGFLGG